MDAPKTIVICNQGALSEGTLERIKKNYLTISVANAEDAIHYITLLQSISLALIDASCVTHQLIQLMKRARFSTSQSYCPMVLLGAEKGQFDQQGLIYFESIGQVHSGDEVLKEIDRYSARGLDVSYL